MLGSCWLPSTEVDCPNALEQGEIEDGGGKHQAAREVFLPMSKALRGITEELRKKWLCTRGNPLEAVLHGLPVTLLLFALAKQGEAKPFRQPQKLPVIPQQKT